MQVETRSEGGFKCQIFTFGKALDRQAVLKMAEHVEAILEDCKDLRLVLDLGVTEQFDVSAFMSAKGVLVSAKSVGPVTRYAVVGAPELAERAIETFGQILPLEARTFPPGHKAGAIEWCCER